MRQIDGMDDSELEELRVKGMLATSNQPPAVPLPELEARTHEELKYHPHTPYDGSWWEYDAQGIPLDRVCAQCRNAKLSKYRPEILTGYTQADVDEPIEES